MFELHLALWCWSTAQQQALDTYWPVLWALLSPCLDSCYQSTKQKAEYHVKTMGNVLTKHCRTQQSQKISIPWKDVFSLERKTQWYSLDFTFQKLPKNLCLLETSNTPDWEASFVNNLIHFPAYRRQIVQSFQIAFDNFRCLNKTTL